MKTKTVIVVILVLMCYCSSFGNGDKRIDKARESLRRRQTMMSNFLNEADVLRSKYSIFRYIKEVEDRMKIHQNWIKRKSGYSHEQLSGPPESFMNEDELKLATEYHLFKIGWYHVRYSILNRAAERDKQVDDKYASIYRCRVFASKAVRGYKYHEEKYLQCYKALTKTAQGDIMRKIEFPKYIATQELNPECSVVSEWHNLEYTESDDIENVKTELDYLIKRMFRRRPISSSNVKSGEFIRYLLTPKGMELNQEIMSKITMFFSVDDLSQPPDKVFRTDRQFLEVAWLFNQYRSLFHELRYNEFLKFLQHGKQGRTHFRIERVRQASKADKASFEHYALLSKGYHEMFQYQPDKIVIGQNTPSASDFLEKDEQIHVSKDEFRQHKHWNGKRKRTTMNNVRMKRSQGTLESAKHESLDEDSQNVESDSLLLDELGDSDNVATVVNDHKAERYKCLGQRETFLTDEEMGIADMLYNEALKNHHLRLCTINRRAPFGTDYDTKVDRQIDISDDVFCEQKQWRSKRKRTALKRGRQKVSEKSDETAEHHSLNVATEEVHREKQNKYQENYFRPTLNEAKQQKSSDEKHVPSDFDCSTAGLSNEDEQAHLFMELIQHFTTAHRVDSKLPLVASSDDMAWENPRLDLTSAPFEAKKELCLVDAHSDFVLCASKNNPKVTRCHSIVTPD